MEGFREIETVIGSYVLPVLLLFWVGVSLLISRISGWSLLARHYRRENPFDGQRWRFQSCRMRWMTRYNNVLTIGVDRRGLHLSMFFLFRPGHPPLFIPWPHLFFEEKMDTRMPSLEFRFRKETSALLVVGRALGADLLSARGTVSP